MAPQPPRPRRAITGPIRSCPSSAAWPTGAFPGLGSTTPPTPPLAAPHALHGVGWERRWAVASQGASAITLSLDHPGDDAWPFAFRAKQHFALHPWGLALTMTLTNQHRASAPAQLGWHPYFPSAGARLGTAFKQHWESDERDLPNQPVPLPNTRWAVEETVWDHCFEGPAQGALAWPGQALRLAWSSAPRSPFRGPCCTFRKRPISSAASPSRPVQTP